MSTSMEPFAAPSESSDAETVGLLHLAVERKHDRTSVLRRRVATGWDDVPDWRFHRHVMRIGLYLRERGQLSAGDRVALVSTLRPEWAVAAWAALTQGVSIATIDPALPDAEMGAQLNALAPRAVFVAGDCLDRVIACLAGTRGAGNVVVLDGQGGGQALSWSEVLDLGGSLDTAERANAFRAMVRALPPDTPALGHAVGANGTAAWRFLSHREVVRRVQRVWMRSRVARGDVAYLTGGAPLLAASVALLAFTADGYTQVVIGTKGNELEDIAMTRPHKIIAPVETVQCIMETASPGPSSLWERWLTRAPRLPGFLRDDGSGRRPPSGLGGRARWLSTGATLALPMRARARKFVTLEIDDSLA
jgi:AMP-binding enzyme